MLLVDVRGNRSMGFASVGAARTATWASRRSRRGTTPKTGGLPVHVATGVFEQIFDARATPS